MLALCSIENVHDVRVNRRAAERVAAGHPWIFRSDLLQTGGAKGGQVVRVLDGRNNALGAAHYSSASQIALRMLPYGDIAETGQAFFRKLIRRAQDFRERVVAGTTAYRVVYGEADLLPALVVDRYGSYFAIQTLNQGMEASKDAIVAALNELFEPKGVVERNDVAVRQKEELAETKGVISGDVPARVEIELNGLRFEVDLLNAQKTGLFLDQRENWKAAAGYARGAAIDCFTYHGAFALHLAAGCQSVEAIDSSAAALEQAGRNASRNGIGNIKFREADVFELLKQRAAARRKYQTVVLDPPAFAKSRQHLEAAARGYKELNRRAMELLDRDGILITCSCSHHLSEADLLSIVAEASLDAGRRVQVIERRTQARDHPILLTVPETHYLKCLVLNVL